MKENFSVLVVEDDDNYRDLLVKYFSKRSFDVIAVSNGLEAFRETEKRDFSLVITDIKMPVMDGLEFLKKLKEKNKTSKVIVLTAYGAMDSYVRALDWGAFDYLHKPVDLNELSTAVDKLLGL
ncbi:MAG: hypothetical protein A2042_02115 [Candidatus Schekmanbacteria bacterium GWA2_38_11]|uniref:Response regulatory domain-containing protein n=1 Tax=Candidatus Schekmanbacteria bacterium GWA2_38_11 TaxID=1817876 RepID=A0A1F7RDR5_9BACT|nr:MAG: hypothetical protein A2042_02115 [Candidatus Schekmanbacteria bacterium GWA2_38_11]